MEKKRHFSRVSQLRRSISRGVEYVALVSVFVCTHVLRLVAYLAQAFKVGSVVGGPRQSEKKLKSISDMVYY